MKATGVPHVHSAEYTRTVARAWDRFVASYPVDSATVRRIVLESWRRCEAHGVDPGRRVAALCDAAPPGGADRALLREGVRTALPPIAAYLAETGSVLIAADEAGVLLAVEGDRNLAERLAGNGAVPGGAWHENQIGTNAVGTALILGRPVQIHGQEHFCEAGKPWSCTAAPIRDPETGAVLGVIDVTGPATAALAQAGAFVIAVTERVHALLTERTLLERARLFELYAAHKRLGDEAVLFDRRGRVVKAGAAARIDDRPVRAGMRLPGFDPAQADRAGLQRLGERIGGGRVTLLEHRGACLGGVVWMPAPPKRGAPAAADPALARPLQAIRDASPSLAPLLAQAQRYAGLRIPLLLQGETGTGKDLLAAAIHASGAAPGAPFVVVNCAAMPSELIASELFGYADGAFTGARRGGAAGRFEQAHGGSIFLDEIGDMPLALQPYLLRAVEDGAVTRIGEARARRAEVRVIAASNRPLAAAVQEGRFRADLFYRLSGAVLDIPPLRERLADLPQLIAALLRQIVPDETDRPAVDAALLAGFRRHDWPGNVRELRSVLARLAACPGESRFEPPAARAPRGGALRSMEREMILTALADAGGSAARAAQALGISRATMYRRLTAYRQARAQGGFLPQ